MFGQFDRTSVYRIASAAFLIAASYHLTALFIPAFAAVAYPPGYPRLRHVAFIGLNVVFSQLFVWRPRWLVWPYALMTLQILNGHGRGAWRLWQVQRRVDWISVALVMGAVALLFFLTMHWRERTRRKPWWTSVSPNSSVRR